MNYFLKFRFLTGQNFRGIPLILAACLLIAIFELVGLGIIGPYIQLVFSAEPGHDSYLDSLNSFFSLQSSSEVVIFWGVVTISIFILKNLLSWLLQNFIIKFAYQNEFDLRTKFSTVILNMDLSSLSKRPSSEYINIMTRHITQFTNQILMATLKLFSEGLAFFFILVFLMVFYTLPTVFILLILSLSISLYLFFVRNKIKLSGSDQATSFDSIIETVSNIIDGSKEIRIFSIKDFFLDNLKRESSKNKDAYFTYTSLQLVPRYMIEALLISSIIGVTILMSLTGNSSTEIIATVGVFGIAAVRLMPGLLVITNSLNNIKNAEHIFLELYDCLKDINISGHDHVLKKIEEVEELNKFEKFSIHDLSFAYPSQSTPVINSVNFEITKGESVGIIGRSGAGKTTFINLLLGLFNNYDGIMKLNNKILNNLNLSDWQKQIAYIPQEKFLVNGSIRDNIALGIPPNLVDEEKLLKAIQVANLDKMVSALPNGMNSLVGEDGKWVSGGQGQRLCLARAIYFDREIIILDEATSSLDINTEDEIISEINNLSLSKTFIIISHRPSILRNCNKVLELKSGRLTPIS